MSTQTLPLVVRPYGPDDRAAVAAVAALQTAASTVDAPWEPPVTPEYWELRLRHGWDGEVPRTYLGTLPGDDRVVAAGEVGTSEWDNRHLAWLSVHVDPAHRRQGYGSTMLAHLRAEAVALGRTILGLDGWESEATRAFAERHGYQQKYVEAIRRQHLPSVDLDALEPAYAEALVHARDYELVRIAGRTPPELLDAVAAMVVAINDAPTDELDIEDEVYPPERVAAYETAQEARGNRLYRVLARHRVTGELAGHTVVAVESLRPGEAGQHDTSVLRAHRGHRLGYLLKAEMVRWLREAEPGVVHVETGNAASNNHMIAVNDELGYELAGNILCFQRDA
ncbi:MAG: GNAT family N-acetyltransferase [Nocardioides sp.]|nr:GNAT family N-acetyltransferase [Nocardioides sp.]